MLSSMGVRAYGQPPPLPSLSHTTRHHRLTQHAHHFDRPINQAVGHVVEGEKSSSKGKKLPPLVDAEPSHRSTEGWPTHVMGDANLGRRRTDLDVSTPVQDLQLFRLSLPKHHPTLPHPPAAAPPLGERARAGLGRGGGALAARIQGALGTRHGERRPLPVRRADVGDAGRERPGHGAGL